MKKGGKNKNIIILRPDGRPCVCLARVLFIVFVMPPKGKQVVTARAAAPPVVEQKKPDVQELPPKDFTVFKNLLVRCHKSCSEESFQTHALAFTNARTIVSLNAYFYTPRTYRNNSS